MVGTDGHRMHVAYPENISDDVMPSPGLWEVVSKNKKAITLKKCEDDTQYPDIFCVFPECLKEEAIEGMKLDFLAAKILRRMNPDTGLNLDYLRDAIKSEDEYWEVRTNGKNAVRFSNGNKEALIMPVRL